MNEVQPVRTKKERESMKKALHGRDKLLFTLGCSLGLRISDLLTLKPGDIRNKTELIIREGKTGKVRRIPISKSVAKAIAAVDTPDEAYLFASRKKDAQGRSKPISRQQAYTVLNKAAQRAGITYPIGGHTLRKTFGLMHYQNGVDITRIMQILNHASPQITLAYIGITREEITEAYEALEV